MTNMYSNDLTGLMQNADMTKVIVVGGLVSDGLLEAEEADEWCSTHAVILHKPKWRLFRRLFKRNEGEVDESTGLVMQLVARLPKPE